MNKYICLDCGYIFEGEYKPSICPVCQANSYKFEKMNEDNIIHELNHLDEDTLDEIKSTFLEECTEVAMYIAMGNQAEREGYKEVSSIYKEIAYEEAEHAAKLAEILGKVEYNTKRNLQSRVNAEYESLEGKLKLAKKTKEIGADHIHEAVHAMCKDEARHSKVFSGLLNNFFK